MGLSSKTFLNGLNTQNRKVSSILLNYMNESYALTRSRPISKDFLLLRERRLWR